MDNANESKDAGLPAGWQEPLPAHLPRPTYWPAALALGMILALLGPVTSMSITVVGLVFAGLALAGWIGDIEHE